MISAFGVIRGSQYDARDQALCSQREWNNEEWRQGIKACNRQMEPIARANRSMGLPVDFDLTAAFQRIRDGIQVTAKEDYRRRCAEYLAKWRAKYGRKVA